MLVAPAIPAAPTVDARFRRAQYRMLGAVMACYLFYYTGRQTFGFAIPGIQQELGLTKQGLGWVSAGMLWAYALGQLINGNLGDRFGGRRMMTAGAVASFILNWLTSFGAGYIAAGAFVRWSIPENASCTAHDPVRRSP